MYEIISIDFLAKIDLNPNKNCARTVFKWKSLDEYERFLLEKFMLLFHLTFLIGVNSFDYFEDALINFV